MPLPAYSLPLRRGNGPLSLEASYTMGANGRSQRTTPAFFQGSRVEGGPQRQCEVGSCLFARRRMEGSLKVTYSPFPWAESEAGMLVFDSGLSKGTSLGRARAGSGAWSGACPASGNAKSDSGFGLLLWNGFCRFGLWTLPWLRAQVKLVSPWMLTAP